MLGRKNNAQNLSTMILSLTAEKNCIMSKISLGNKIARACRASAICSLCKIYKRLLHRIVREIVLLLVNIMNRKSQKVKQTKF